MAKYMLEMPHTVEQCMEMSDDLASYSDLRKNAWWGCEAGLHKVWALVDAESAEDALDMIPEIIRDTACVAEVQQFTEEDVREWHKEKVAAH